MTFDPGQALWVEAESEENAFVTAGQVGTKDITVQLQNGATMSGNASPVAVDLQDILCRDEDSDLVLVSTLDSVGAIVKTYNWINDGKVSYWIDGATGKKPDPAVTFKPGEGLWVEGDSEENEITFPAVEL